MNTIVGFLSRTHGLNVLNSLVRSSEYKLVQVFTHRLNPSSQDPSRSEREDYCLFEKVCKQNQIPLTSIDSKNYNFTDFPKCDFIVEVSWRYMIPHEIAKKAKIAAFGIHRGKLPEYAGSEPIKQALKNNEKEIILSAHDLVAEIDKGAVFETSVFPVNYEMSSPTEHNIQKIRDEITPLFPKLVIKTLDKFSNKIKN